MKVRHLHDWQVTTGEARRIQESLAGQVSRNNDLGEVKLIAGVDISARSPRGTARAAVVVVSYPDLSVVEVKTVEKTPLFPYIPGLLSFRETPLIVEACAQLQSVPDLVLADGQGIAHPRRFGLAAHVGLLLDTPTIGCAKSRLLGDHGEIGPERGSWSELRDGQEVIGAVLRTRTGVAPLYISIGHRIDLESAMQWVLRCCCDKRLPEPIRLAHLAAGGRLPGAGTSQEDGRTCAYDDTLIKYLKH